MRGAVSLAVALALPLSTVSGPFPQRDLIIFLTFVVILVTLVLQGLSLLTVIRRVGVSDGGAEEDEETRARLVATKAALKQIDTLADEEWTRDDSIERMRGMCEFRTPFYARRSPISGF
jgi:monovalent cation/hydrogen antiporter